MTSDGWVDVVCEVARTVLFSVALVTVVAGLVSFPAAVEAIGWAGSFVVFVVSLSVLGWVSES